MRIAFLGIGRMGRELALHAIDAGHDVTVWNRSPEPAEALAGKGATAAGSAADAVDGAELVITVLFGPDVVRTVVLGGDLPFGAGAAWVDVTTVAPADADEFAGWATGRGIGYAHSPVIGSLGPAHAGALGVLLGGPAPVVDVARPIVALWADPDRLRVVSTPGQAAAGKLVANLALAVTAQAVAEAVRLGDSAGLTVDEVLDQLLDKSALQSFAGMKGDMIRAAGFDETQFSVDALAKDAGLMVRTAKAPLPAVTAAYAALQARQRAGQGERDFAVITRDDC
jgi:3-hydroxyisobutyrate dehydrogenase